MGLASQTPLRRVVTHHKGTKSAVLIDDELRPFPGFGSNAITVWQNAQYPAELVNQDPTGSPVIYTRGSLIRVVDFPPNSQGHNHGTASLDYGIVFDGELELVLQDGSRTIVRAGDIVVQQATIHQWNNLTDKHVRVVFSLIPSQKKTVDDVGVKDEGVTEEYLPHDR